LVLAATAETPVLAAAVATPVLAAAANSVLAAARPAVARMLALPLTRLSRARSL
jgi:hypothetical protein